MAHRSSRRWPIPAALTVLGLIAIGVAGLQVAGHPTGGRPAQAAAAPNWGDPRGASKVAVQGGHAGASPQASLPAGSVLTLPGIRGRVPIVTVTDRDGVMDVPADPRTLGWWSGGTVPGAAAGTAVIVGHVNYAGVTGALAALPQSRAGDEVTIIEPHGLVRYRITAVRSYPKTSGIPAAAFRRTGPPRLALITCGGPFDPATGNYLDNVVAYAVVDNGD